MLAFDVFGGGRDPTVVLLHGWPFDRTIWTRTASLVAARGFRVVCPDFPGFGDSPPLAAREPTVEDYATAVEDFLRDRAFAPATVAGHSFGGYVALAMAELGPDRMTGLGLISSRSLADSEAARRGRYETIEAIRAKGPSALLPGLAAKVLAPAATAGLRERAAKAIESARAEGVIAGLAAMASRPDRSSLVESFSGPVLVVHGSEDQLIPPDQAPRPPGRSGVFLYRVLPGVGHMPMWEAPEPLAEAIASCANAARGPRA